MAKISPQTNRKVIKLSRCFIQTCAFLLMYSQSPLAFGQSQVEIESELSVGDSDAALAEEKQIQARLEEDLKKEDESSKAAARSYEITKKKTADIRAHIEQMKIATAKSEKNRQESLNQIKLNQKKLSKLELSEAEFKTKLAESEARLSGTNSKRDQLLAQIAKTKEQIQKTKDDIVASKQKEHLAKSEVKSANSNLKKAKANLAESKKWRDKEVARMSLEIKRLTKDQAMIEAQIRVSSAQIKKLQEVVNASRKKNALASENHQRAAALKNENDVELNRLQRLNRTPASKSAQKPKANNSVNTSEKSAQPAPANK